VLITRAATLYYFNFCDVIIKFDLAIFSGGYLSPLHLQGDRNISPHILKVFHQLAYEGEVQVQKVPCPHKVLLSFVRTSFLKST
jgi:hypothetical protein